MTEESEGTVWWCVHTGSRIEISQVISVKETSQTLWLSTDMWGYVHGREKPMVIRKISTWGHYFPTWPEAHAFALDVVGRRLERARRALSNAQAQYGNVKGWKEPAARKS